MVLTVLDRQHVGLFFESSLLQLKKIQDMIGNMSTSFVIFKRIQHVNTLRLRQNGHHFADDIFKCIFLNENVWIPIKFSLQFVPKGPINNNPAQVQIIAWRRPGDKPLSEPVMVSILMHICVTRPQWVKRQITQQALRQWNRYKILSNNEGMTHHLCLIRGSKWTLQRRQFWQQTAADSDDEYIALQCWMALWKKQKTIC